MKKISFKTFILIGLMLITFFLIACSANNQLARMSSEDKWKNAENYFNRGKYNRAIPYYQQLVLKRRSIFVAEAQFKLAECFFRRGDRESLLEAIFEYQEFLRLFADHRLASEAQYNIALSYKLLSLSPHFTQEETHRAIDLFNRFIERHPFDDRVDEARKSIADLEYKLIEKIYLNGYIYFKMRDYPAAELYLNEIIQLGNADKLEKLSMYYIALIHIDRREDAAAYTALQHLKTHFPNDRETKIIENRYNRINARIFKMNYFQVIMYALLGSGD